MKRGGNLKRYTPLKRSGFKRAKKIGVKAAKAKAWMWFSRFIRLRDSFEGRAKCCTCGFEAPITGKGCIQAGHFVAGRNNSILYVEDNVHAQCAMCNRWRRGNPVAYEMFMRKHYTFERIEELKQLSLKVVPMSAENHKQIASEYEKKVSELGGWPE